MDQAEPLRNIIKAGTVSVNKPQARVISVTSGKGGVGKSNTAINLAIQFRRQGLKVIILDADFGLANIEIMFGAIPTYNLYDLITREKTSGKSLPGALWMWGSYREVRALQDFPIWAGIIFCTSLRIWRSWTVLPI